MGNLYTEREKIVRGYLEAYNAFDVERMLVDLAEEIIFLNVVNGKVEMSLQGIQDFRKQAREATALFRCRRQRIISIKQLGGSIEIEVAFEARLKVDFAGLQPGDKVELRGKSIFEFEENKIIKLTDIS